MTIKIEKPEDTDVEKIELFSLEGVSYYIENRPRANVALKYMRLAKSDSTEAGRYLVETLIGPEAWEALENCEYLTSEQLNAVITFAAQIVIGGVEDEEGKA